MGSEAIRCHPEKIWGVRGSYRRCLNHVSLSEDELNFPHVFFITTTSLLSCASPVDTALVPASLFTMDLARAVTAVATVSITRDAQFLGLRACANTCVLGSDFSGEITAGLLGYIGCPYPWYNVCYCNTAIVTQASSFISSCISAACSELDDVPSAVAAWEGYCGSAGFPMNNIAQTTVETITSGTITKPTTLVVTVPNTIAPTVTAITSGGFASGQGSFGSAPSTSSPNSDSQSTSTSTSSTSPTQSNVGAIAGGVVGGVVAIGIAAVIITMLVLREKRRARREQLLAPVQPWQPPTAPSLPQSPPIQPPQSQVVTEKIPKTPAMAQTTPIYRAEERAYIDPELDGASRMRPELGVGSNQPWSHVPEMQA